MSRRGCGCGCGTRRTQVRQVSKRRFDAMFCNPTLNHKSAESVRRVSKCASENFHAEKVRVGVCICAHLEDKHENPKVPAPKNLAKLRKIPVKKPKSLYHNSSGGSFALTIIKCTLMKLWSLMSAHWHACTLFSFACTWPGLTGRLGTVGSVNTLAKEVTTWTQLCDKRLARLVGLVGFATSHSQCCCVGDVIENCKLGLFQDASFAGDLQDSKSTLGDLLCILGSNVLDVKETNRCVSQQC